MVAEVIDNIVKTLARDYRPARIVLFGSYVSGTQGPDSDVDLLIIKDTPKRFLDRWVDVRRILAGTHTGIPLDAVVLTREELKQRLDSGDQFLAGALKEGKVLYEA